MRHVAVSLAVVLTTLPLHIDGSTRPKSRALHGLRASDKVDNGIFMRWDQALRKWTYIRLQKCMQNAAAVKIFKLTSPDV